VILVAFALVEQQLDMSRRGGRHLLVAHLRRFLFAVLAFPALTGWANFWRASGAREIVGSKCSRLQTEQILLQSGANGMGRSKREKRRGKCKMQNAKCDYTLPRWGASPSPLRINGPRPLQKATGVSRGRVGGKHKRGSRRGSWPRGA